MQKTDKFIMNGMAVQSGGTHITAEMFARQISGLMLVVHSTYSRTPAGDTGLEQKLHFGSSNSGHH